MPDNTNEPVGFRECQAQRKRAAEWLRKYGQHQASLGCHFGMYSKTHCVCGLTAIIEGLERGT